MTLNLPTQEVKSAFHAALANALAAEKNLAHAAHAEIAQLVEELYPLLVSQTQALLTAPNPQIPQTYLNVLQGTVSATIAKLGLRALAEQRTTLSLGLQTGIQILALVLRAVMV